MTLARLIEQLLMQGKPVGGSLQGCFISLLEVLTRLKEVQEGKEGDEQEADEAENGSEDEESDDEDNESEDYDEVTFAVSSFISNIFVFVYRTSAFFRLWPM